MNISASNITFSYKNSSPIFSKLSFEINSGDIIFLLGHNGVGKTTLFKCLLGHLKIQEGEILIDNQSIYKMKQQLIAKKISYIPQAHFPTFNHLVIDVVLMGMMSKLGYFESPGKVQEKEAFKAMELLGISHLAYKGYGEISGGERQLCLIARAIVQGSDTFIMDEPCANLDYGNQLLILEQCRKLAKLGRAIIISSHNPDHALWYSNKVLAIHEREILCYGSTQKVLNETILSKIYAMNIKIATLDNGSSIKKICIPADF